MPQTAASLMTTQVITVRPELKVNAAAKLLSEHAISAVPVLDADGALVGMLSEGDLLRPFGQEYALRRDGWLNLLAEGTDLAPLFVEYLREDQRSVGDLMTTPVVTADVSASLPEIADLWVKHRIKRVPILENGALVGIVSRADLVRTLTHSSVNA